MSDDAIYATVQRRTKKALGLASTRIDFVTPRGVFGRSAIRPTSGA
jgi:hypothetical protein